MAKISFQLILLLIFILPWQTRLILRPGILNGAPWEYGHLGLFVTEILLWLIVVLELFLSRERIRLYLKQNKITLVVAASLISLSFLAANDKFLTLQTMAHYLAAIGLAVILKNLSTEKKRAVALVFIAAMSLQAALGIYQFLSQSSFGNRWLGLVAHPVWLPGAAVLENTAGRFLRAYGSLPHPNILGGYLVIGLILLVVFRWSNSPLKQSFFWPLYSLFLTALFFTFSRSAWLAWLASFFLLGYRKKQLIIATLAVFLFYSALFYPLLISRVVVIDRLELVSKAERMSQYHEAWQLIKKNPWLGTGAGQYTLALHRLFPEKSVWQLQPVHNIFVLALAEWGIIGLALLGLIFLKFFSFFSKAARRVNWLLLTPLIIIGLFDHYLLSLWSGNILIAAAIGLLDFSAKNLDKSQTPALLPRPS